MKGGYILDDEGNTVLCNDLLEWAEWFEHAEEKRRIGYDEVGDLYVSTMFLGLDHSFGIGDKPLLFETMVFEKKESTNNSIRGKEFKFHQSLDDYTERYSTKEEAADGHKRIIEKVKKDLDKT